MTVPEPIPYDASKEHARAKELGSHRRRVAEIKQRAHHWRLTDCDLQTLAQMRHALIEEMETMENDLNRADRQFFTYMQNGLPLQTEKSLQQIDRLAIEWETLNTHLQEVDEALIERELRQRMERYLGGSRGVYILDIVVFVSIIVVVGFTLLSMVVPLGDETISLLNRIDTYISLFLLADFFFRLALSPDKGWYIRNYWIDFFASIPFHEFARLGEQLVPIARAARLLRLLRLGRAVRVLIFTFRGLGKLLETFQLGLLKRALIIAGALLFFGALTIGSIEGSIDPDITSLDQSLWWSFTTVVTGGFADLYNPTTTAGRLITVGLVLLGLTVTGIFTASLTTVLFEDESTRIEQNQRNLDSQLSVLNQKLDLLSSETNRGLIALETVAQQLSNQENTTAVGQVLCEAMLRDFECLQASVHLLDEHETMLARVAVAGELRVAAPERLVVGDAFTGRITADLLALPNPADIDIEPVIEPSTLGRGIEMVCPLVAGQRVIGMLHTVLPEELGRFYLYNRAPQTLAHHAAAAIYALQLEQGGERGDVGRGA